MSIRVKGHLDLSWQEWAEGSRSSMCQMVRWFSGTLTGQPALSGLYMKLSRMSLTLLSSECVELGCDECR